jgi:hypothetical protein
VLKALGGGFQIVYILDQVRAMESEMLKNIKEQGLDIKPQIVVVRTSPSFFIFL